MHCTYPTGLWNRCKGGGSSIYRAIPLRRGILAKQTPRPFLVFIAQTSACVYKEFVKPSVFSSGMLLVWLLPFLAQWTRSQKWNSSKGFRPLLIRVVGIKQRNRRQETHGWRLLNATFRIYACMHKLRKTLPTHTHKYVHTLFFFTFLCGGKVTLFQLKITEKNLLP